MQTTVLTGQFQGYPAPGNTGYKPWKLLYVFYTAAWIQKILASAVEVPEEDDRVLVAFMEQKGIVIELYQVTLRASQELGTRNDGHVDHIAFDVADVDKAFAEFKAASFEMLHDKPVFLNFWEQGMQIFCRQGAGWEKLEFNQIL